jgi:hypothetical protein
MDSQDRQQLEEYVRQQGDTTKTVDSNPDGTQDVCVLEREADGSYEEHYYRQEDHFGDYLMYSMLLGNSNTLMTYGLISGDLSASDYVMLKLLTGVGDDGRAYHPYTRGGDGSYVRQKTVINNVNVTHVHYGSSAPLDLKTAKKQKPPAGYEAKPTLKPNTNPGIKRGGLGVPGATNGYTPKPTTSSTKPAVPPKTTQAPPKCPASKPLGTYPNCKARPTTSTKKAP